MSREGEKGCVIPYREVSVGGVKIPIDVVLVAREGGKDKNSWTGKRRPRRGRGGSGRHRGRWMEERRRRRKIFRRIHIFEGKVIGGASGKGADGRKELEGKSVLVKSLA